MNGLGSGFMTIGGEFGRFITFMLAWSWRPRTMGSLLTPTGEK